MTDFTNPARAAHGTAGSPTGRATSPVRPVVEVNQNRVDEAWAAMCSPMPCDDETMIEHCNAVLRGTSDGEKIVAATSIRDQCRKRIAEAKKAERAMRLRYKRMAEAEAERAKPKYIAPASPTIDWDGVTFRVAVYLGLALFAVQVAIFATILGKV